MIDGLLAAARSSAVIYEEVERDRGTTGQALIIMARVTIASTVGRMVGAAGVEAVRGLVAGIIRGVAS